MRNGLHSLLVNTIQTLEETGRTVCDVYQHRALGVHAGPGAPGLGQVTACRNFSETPGAHRGLQRRVSGDHVPETASAGLAGDALAQLIELAQKMGDPVIERALDFVLADANTWVRKDQAYAVA